MAAGEDQDYLPIIVMYCPREMYSSAVVSVLVSFFREVAAGVGESDEEIPIGTGIIYRSLERTMSNISSKS